MLWLDLKIGGQRVTVHLVKPDDPHLDESYGACDFDEGRIYIANNLGPGVLEDTLWHELDHYVDDTCGAKRALLKAVQAARKRGDAAIEAAVELDEDMRRARTPVWHRLLKDLGFVFPKGPTE